MTTSRKAFFLQYEPIEKELKMFCPNCGKEMPGNARFCPSCGKPIPAVQKASSKNTEGQKAPIQVAKMATENASAAQASKAKKNIPVWIKFLIAVVILLVAGCVITGVQTNTSKPYQPENLQEFCEAHPDYLNSQRNALLSAYQSVGANVFIADATLSASGNQLTFVMYTTTSQSEMGALGQLITTLANDFESKALAQNYVDYVTDLEKQTGLSGLTLHVEFRYQDGGIIASQNYNDAGVIK